MRSVLITVGSLVLTAGVLTNAYLHKRQFYPSVVYITKSSPSMAVLYVQALVFVVLLGKVMRQIFFSQLRSAEMEHLIERSWYAVTETCLAFTVFRDDFSPRFVALFTILLFLKCFHWLAEDRIDYMERSPVITWLFHIRAISLLMLLGMLDAFFVSHAYSNTLIKGPSVQLVFGFEYAILLTVVLHIFVKYILHTIDVQSENPWENKAVYLLYTELALGLVKCFLYVTFLAIMMKVHTFPLFVIRPMYLTIREFKKALHDVVMSRRAIRNMNTLYPDASPEDLASGDNVCIICREEMHASCKKLPCNHIFHTSCLRSWFQRQQTCPTCRMDVLRPAGVTANGGAAAAVRQQQPQQPAAAAPQQQPLPPQPPMFPGFMGGIPPVPPIPGLFPPFNPPPPPPQPTSTAASPPPSTTFIPGTPPSMWPGGPMPGMWPPAPGFSPFMMSPPPLVLPPFAIPTLSAGGAAGMPPPPGTLGLSDEELRLMEGEERRNVEARIRCLQDINILLTAALTQMQQYTTVTGGSSTRQAPAHGFNLFSPPSAEASSSAASVPAQSSDMTSSETRKAYEAFGAIPKTSKLTGSANVESSGLFTNRKPATEASSDTSKISSESKKDYDTQSTDSVNDASSPEAETGDVKDGLRRRTKADQL